jgi:hypothetical protein
VICERSTLASVEASVLDILFVLKSTIIAGNFHPPLKLDSQLRTHKPLIRRYFPSGEGVSPALSGWRRIVENKTLFGVYEALKDQT